MTRVDHPCVASLRHEEKTSSLRSDWEPLAKSSERLARCGRNGRPGGPEYAFEDGKISPENLRVNYGRLHDSRIDWVRPEDEKIFLFVKTFFNNNLDLPSGRILLDYFTRSDDIEVQERIGDIGAAEPYVRTNYAHLLGQLCDDQDRVKMLALLKQTTEVVSKGLVIKEGKEKKRIQGIEDGIRHFNQHAYAILPQDSSAQTYGDLRKEGQAAWDEYQTAKLDKSKAWGKFTGLNNIDEICRGLKRGEMWVHAAFAGDLKSTWAMSWTYNLVTRYRTNVLYVSLEMPYAQVRRIICVMHSANGRFRSQGHEPLDYRKVRDGELTPEEEAHYEEVLRDWDESKEYCRFKVWCPDRDVTIDDVRQKAEILHKEMDVGFVVIDHAGLLEARRRFSTYGVEQNSIFRDAKLMALHFHGGEGVPVLMLMQTSREGRKAAEQNGGVYNMRALSWAHEAERSADVISSTYLDDEHRANGTTLCCCLKNRDNPHFPPTTLRVRFGCRRLENPVLADAPDIGTDDDWMEEV